MEEEEYDYESLGGNTSMTQNALAGAMAGIAEHCAMYPVDSIKVSLGTSGACMYLYHQDIDSNASYTQHGKNGSNNSRGRSSPKTRDDSQLVEGRQLGGIGSRSCPCVTLCNV